MTIYDQIFIVLYKFANYKVYGILLPRLLMPFAILGVLWLSRLASSVYVKVFSIVIGLILYYLRDIVNLFLT